MVVYDSGGMYKYYKAEYPNNPYIIQDEALQNKLRMMNYENGLCLIGDIFEVYAWHPNYPNRIAVSDMGNVVDITIGAKLRIFTSLDKYLRVKIDNTINFVHRLVAFIFIPNPMHGYMNIVNHKDGIKTHNWVTNLEWTTSSFNMVHSASVISMGNIDKKEYTWDEKVTIITMLTQGAGEKEIADAINYDISNERNHLRFRKNLSKVRKGRWPEVWQYLGLTPKMAYRPKDYREKMKEIIKNDPDIDYHTLSQMVGEPYGNGIIALARRIKKELMEETGTNNNNIPNLNSSVIDKIAFLIDKGWTIRQISQETKIPDNEYFYAFINNLKNGSLYPHITRKYKSFPTYNPYYSI